MIVVLIMSQHTIKVMRSTTVKLRAIINVRKLTIQVHDFFFITVALIIIIYN